METRKKPKGQQGERAYRNIHPVEIIMRTRKQNLLLILFGILAYSPFASGQVLFERVDGATAYASIGGEDQFEAGASFAMVSVEYSSPDGVYYQRASASMVLETSENGFLETVNVQFSQSFNNGSTSANAGYYDGWLGGHIGVLSLEKLLLLSVSRWSSGMTTRVGGPLTSIFQEENFLIPLMLKVLRRASIQRSNCRLIRPIGSIHLRELSPKGLRMRRLRGRDTNFERRSRLCPSPRRIC